MKKAIILIFLFLFAGNDFVPAQNKLLEVLRKGSSANAKSGLPNKKAAVVANSSRPGRSANYNWDDQNSQWVYVDSSEYKYVLSGGLSSETKRNGVPISRVTYTYDAQDRVVQELHELWNNTSNSWEGNSRKLYKYNAHGYLYESLDETYNAGSSMWELQYGNKNLLTYDAFNRITDNIYLEYHLNTNTWENDYRDSDFTYDANNNMTKRESYTPNGNLWDKDYRVTLVYALNNQPTQVTTELWNGSAYDNSERWVNVTFQNWCGWDCDATAIKSGTYQTWASTPTNQWNDGVRISTSYDAFGGYIRLDEQYTGTTWENSHRYTESYDTQFNFTDYTFESWSAPNSIWIIIIQYNQLHTYDLNSDITQTIWQYWHSPTQALKNLQKKVYSNFTYVGIRENSNEQFSTTVFPNPCSGECHLRFEGQAWQKNTEKQFALFDAQGKEIMSETTLNSEFDLNTETLPKGLYFYVVKQGSEIGAKGKLLVE